MKELEACITSKTRMIVLNTPHNPVGKVFTRDELQQVADIAIRHDLLVISDEVVRSAVYLCRVHTTDFKRYLILVYHLISY